MANEVLAFEFPGLKRIAAGRKLYLDAEQVSRLEAAGMCSQAIIELVTESFNEQPRPLVEILDEILQEAGDGD